MKTTLLLALSLILVSTQSHAITDIQAVQIAKSYMTEKKLIGPSSKLYIGTRFDSRSLPEAAYFVDITYANNPGECDYLEAVVAVGNSGRILEKGSMIIFGDRFDNFTTDTQWNCHQNNW